MEFLYKIAAVLVAMLLYCVLTILQMPRTAHGAVDPGQHLFAGANKTAPPIMPGHLHSK